MGSDSSNRGVTTSSCFRFRSSSFAIVFGIFITVGYLLWIFPRSGNGSIRYAPPAHKPIHITQTNLTVSSHAKTVRKPPENFQNIKSAKSAGPPQKITSAKTAGTPQQIKSAKTAGTPQTIKSAKTAGTPQQNKSTKTAGTPQTIKSAKTAGTPQTIKSAKTEVTSIRIHYYNRPSWIPKEIFSGCNNKCHLTEGEGDSYTGSDVVVFHTPYITEQHPPKKMGQIWVFHSLEPPGVHRIKFNNWKNVFNWTISYRRDADITNTYGIFSTRKHNRDHVKKEFNGLYTKWQNKPKNTVWMVSNCDTNGKRHLYVKELQKLMKVDVYGKCGTKNKCPRTKTKECLNPYKFYLSFESQLCEDYITEKSFKLYSSDVTTLPIVRSGSHVSMFLPPGSYIDTTKFKQKKNLVKHMKSLSKNKPKFQKYIHWRESYQVNKGTTHSMAFCELCRRLHQKDVHQNQRLYTDIGEWLYGDHSKRKSCKPPNDIN